MKDLFDPTLADDIKQRIMRLHPESERRWGNMTVAQTLAHCTSGIQMATGVIKPKRASFPTNVIGLVIKPLVFGDDKPMRRNSPSSPELFSVDPTQPQQWPLSCTNTSTITYDSSASEDSSWPQTGIHRSSEFLVLYLEPPQHAVRRARDSFGGASDTAT
jgi:hypothetical protein